MILGGKVSDVVLLDENVILDGAGFFLSVTEKGDI